MREGDLIVSGSPSDYEIVLQACRAISPQGYLIEVNESNRPAPLRGSNDQHRESIVPIYLEVRGKESVPTTTAQSTVLLEARSLRWAYALTTEPSANAYDRLQIGQMRKEGARFVVDNQYIPESVYLNSHPLLVNKVKTILQTAQASQQILGQYARSGCGFSHLIAANMAAALAPASIISDWQIYLRDWLNRLTEMLVSLFQLILPLANLQPPLASWVPAKDQIENAISYIKHRAEAQLQIWDALDHVQKAMEALIPLYGELREPEQPYERPEPSPGFIPVTPVSSQGSLIIRKCSCNAYYTVRPGQVDPGRCPNCVGKAK